MLAIGQNVQEKNGQRVVVGSNATLELSPAQVETIAAAQHTSGAILSLALRSLVDDGKVADAEPKHPVDRGITVVRFGVPTLEGRQ